MGNTQSAEAPRRPPTKLTKPRTNTSTSNLLATVSTASRRSSNLDLPAASNKRSSTITIDDVTDVDESGLNKAADLPKRRSLFRSKSAAVESSTRKVDLEKGPHGYSASNPLHRYSSVGSMRVDKLEEPHHGRSNIRPPIRASRSATAHHSHMQHFARLSLVVEVQTPEPEVQGGSKQLGVPRQPPDEDIQEEQTPIERSTSDLSLSIPIRRRSLLTPGIATRSSSKDDMSRKSTLKSSDSFEFTQSAKVYRRSLPAPNTPSQEQLRQYYYDQSKPTSSPLDDLAALRVQMDMNQDNRAVTPCGLDYGYTGAFKLGSLRITNGAASPAPSGHKREYWDDQSPVNAKRDESCPAQTEIPPKKEELPHGRLFAEWTSTSVDVTSSEPAYRYDLSDEPPRIVETMVEIPGFSLGWAAFQSSESTVQDFHPTPPTTASELAQVYMQDIASSPFSFEGTPPPSPKFQATSKTMAIEDHLFDDEDGSLVSLASPSPLQRTSKRLSQSRPAKQVLPGLNTEASESSTSKRIQGPREQAPKPLEKADSGYSSKTSLRSFRSRVSNSEKESARQDSPPPVVPSKSPPRPPPKTLYSRDSYGASVKSTTVQGVRPAETEDPPATPAKDMPSAHSNEITGFFDNARRSHSGEVPRDESYRSPYPDNSSVPQQQSSHSVSRRSGPPPLPIKSIEQTQAAAKMPAETPASPSPPAPKRLQSMPDSVPAMTVRPGLKQSESELSIATTRKLQKQRPTAQASVIVQGYTEIETANIPPVSQDAADHLEERLKNFPTLTHTYKSVHRTNSKETLSTIFSMAPAEHRTEETVSFTRFGGIHTAPSNDDIEQSVIKQSVVMHVAQPKSVPVKPKFWRRSLDGMRGRRKSMETPNSDDESGADLPSHQYNIKDFGTISQSLGASPYEIAKPAHADPKFSQSSTISNDHTGGKPARRRIIGMNSQSAAQFARDRSRILRRQSFDDEIGHAHPTNLPVIVPSPHDMVVDAPPIPALPTEATRERPGLKRIKSPPPVSMTAPWAKWAATMSAPSQPVRPAPVLPSIPVADSVSQIELINKSSDQSENLWQRQESLWRRKKESANESFQKKFLPRRSLDSASTGNPELSLRQQYRQHPQILIPGPPPAQQNNQPSQHTGRRPSLGQQSQAISTRTLPWELDQQRSQPKTTRPSLEQQSSAPSSLHTQNRALAHQAFQSMQPRLGKRTLARASFDSIASIQDKRAHPLSHSVSSTDVPSLPPLTVDRYNGGFGYDYEHGYGIGGSAGTRSDATAASRKAVEGSLLWGVDFSDVPIIVRQTPRSRGS